MIINSTDPNNGAKIFDESRLFHVQSSAKLKIDEDLFKKLEVGARARLYDPESNGTIFTDSIGNDVTNFEFGGFVQATKELPNNTELTASLRIDKNENFNLTTSQRLTAVREIKPSTFLRASLQRGQRIPNVREQFFNQNLGELRVVGGLPQVVDQYGLQDNAFLVSSLNEYNQASGDEVNRLLKQPNSTVNIDALKLQYLDIMERGIIRPDQLTELSLKRLLVSNWALKAFFNKSDW